MRSHRNLSGSLLGEHSRRLFRMRQNRHWFALEPVQVPPQFQNLLSAAARFEVAGNWALAGERYIELFDALESIKPPVVLVARARVATRAGACLELAQAHSPSAAFYDRAANTLAGAGAEPFLAGELSNRAALQFRAASEYFSAGVAWARAGEQFAKVPGNAIICRDTVPPLPGSALKSHLCGLCFEAAAASYEKATGNEMWSVMAYWRAGQSYASGIPNIQAYDAYRKAIIAHVRYYGTLDAEQMRLSLPMSDDERARHGDQLTVMEAALVRCNNHHQERPGDTPQSRLQTNRQIAAAFHAFTLELLAVGNPKEAARFRVAQNDRNRAVMRLQGNYGTDALYLVWKATSNYGESLGRWAVSCVLVILTWAVAYGLFSAVGSSDSPDRSLRLIDYIYFSVVTFSTLGYGDLHPIGALGKVLACLEVFAGLIMFGLLLSFVSNRFQRI